LLASVVPVKADPLSVAYLDSVSGWEWAQVSDTTGLTWDDISGVCGIDGQTACTGDLGTKGLGGWTWATSQQVLSLFTNATDLTAAELADEDEDLVNSTWAPMFTSVFTPTYFGEGFRGVAAISADGPAFDARGAWVPHVIDSFGPGEDTASKRWVIAQYTSSPSVGVWLHRNAVERVPEPATLSLAVLGLAGLALRQLKSRSRE
jgi:hypothetical protein